MRFKCPKPYRAIQGDRNVGLVHRHRSERPTEEPCSGARRVVDDDERKSSMRVQIVELLNDVRASETTATMQVSRNWQERAESFWRSICDDWRRLNEAIFIRRGATPSGLVPSTVSSLAVCLLRSPD